MNVVCCDKNNNVLCETGSYNYEFGKKYIELSLYVEVHTDSVYIHLESYKYKWILVVDEIKLLKKESNFKLSGTTYYYQYRIKFKKKFGSHDFAKVKSEFESYLRVEKIKSLNF